MAAIHPCTLEVVPRAQANQQPHVERAQLSALDRNSPEKVTGEQPTVFEQSPSDILNQESVQVMMRKVWNASTESKTCGIPDSVIMVFSFFSRIGSACVNVAYILLTLRELPDSCDAESEFCFLERAVAWIEAIVIVVSGLRVAAETVIMILASKSKHSAKIQGSLVAVMLDNIQVVSAFSLLAFLPVPSKLMYWFSHGEYLLHMYVMDPPILRACPINLWRIHTWKLWSYSNVNEYFSKSYQYTWCLIWLLGIPFLAACLICVQVLIPLTCGMFPLLAPFAFLVKVEALPNVKVFSSWDVSDWLLFLGVLNQTGKIWDIEGVEVVALEHLFNATVANSKDWPAPGKVHDELMSGGCKELGWWRTVMLRSSLSARTGAPVVAKFLTVVHEGVGESKDI